MKEKDITVIVPLHEIVDGTKDLINRCFDKLNNVKIAEDSLDLIVVGPADVVKEIKIFAELGSRTNVRYLVNKGETDFCSQVNLAVKECKTEWFSVLEFDDYYKPNWFKNVELYSEYKSDVSMFLPLNELVDMNDKFYSFINEIVHAGSFSNELGYIDSECLQVYYDFNVTGGIIKTEDFLTIGGLKPSIKLSFWYEFLLRMCHNNMKIYVVPKLGYVHTIGREGSLSNINQKTITQEEGQFWITTAQQESVFLKNREKKYEKQ